MLIVVVIKLLLLELMILGCFWNKDTALCCPTVHFDQHDVSPVQSQPTARGVGLEKDTASRYKQNIVLVLPMT
jgi:hypothetical protein